MTKDLKKLILTEQDYDDAAQLLGVNKAVIKAVAEVESAGNGFLNNGMVKILFEAHIFSKLTGGKYDKTHPSISAPKWDKSLYKGGVKEYERLNEALKLNIEAAYKSTSFGKFQIVGYNYSSCGYASVLEFVNAMQTSEGEHLKAFVNFIKSKGMDKLLQKLDWAGFARSYNGSGYKLNRYDERLAVAYKKYSEAL
ncbi:MAG: N-acetylmuramidase family protein [Ignavibacterium sp.]|nr:N-acetylmuramidase family protein [Ignavibacterium sp.]MDW8376416.1 N-acetylmuramidase family protein [Ignavibacteriales bacterium]